MPFVDYLPAFLRRQAAPPPPVLADAAPDGPATPQVIEASEPWTERGNDRRSLVGRTEDGFRTGVEHRMSYGSTFETWFPEVHPTLADAQEHARDFEAMSRHMLTHPDPWTPDALDDYVVAQAAKLGPIQAADPLTADFIGPKQPGMALIPPRLAEFAAATAEAMQRTDWWSDYSDDGDVRRRGRDQRDHAQGMLNRLAAQGDAGRELASVLWQKHAEFNPPDGYVPENKRTLAWTWGADDDLAPLMQRNQDKRAERQNLRVNGPGTDSPHRHPRADLWAKAATALDNAGRDVRIAMILRPDNEAGFLDEMSADRLRRARDGIAQARDATHAARRTPILRPEQSENDPKQATYQRGRIGRAFQMLMAAEDDITDAPGMKDGQRAETIDAVATAKVQTQEAQDMKQEASQDAVDAYIARMIRAGESAKPQAAQASTSLAIVAGKPDAAGSGRSHAMRM